MTHRVHLVRDYDHPPARVFDAFSNPKTLARWIAPSEDVGTRIDRFEFRPEGRYRYCFAPPDGPEISVAGQFLRILAPELLSFTWVWEAPDIHAGIESHVEITIAAAGSGACLSLTHNRLTESAMPARHKAGWQGSLARLNDILAAQKD